MSLIGETVDLLQQQLGEQLSHMRVEGLVVGVFFTGVKLTGEFFGMARTPIEELPEAVCCPASVGRMPRAGELRKEKVTDLMLWALDRNVLKAAVGVATLNALSRCLWEKKGFPGCKMIEGEDAFDFLNFSSAKKVTLVGAFAPYIRQLSRMNVELTVLEANPRALTGEAARYFCPAQQAPAVLPRSDVVILTGSTIVNHTIDELLSLAPRNGQVAVIGPTASLHTRPFFRRRVSVMGGVKVIDADNALRVLAEGGSGRHIEGKFGEKVVFLPSVVRCFG